MYIGENLLFDGICPDLQIMTDKFCDLDPEERRNFRVELRNALVTYFLRPETLTFNLYHNGHKNVHNKISHFHENKGVLEHI